MACLCGLLRPWIKSRPAPVILIEFLPYENPIHTQHQPGAFLRRIPLVVLFVLINLWGVLWRHLGDLNIIPQVGGGVGKGVLISSFDLS